MIKAIWGLIGAAAFAALCSTQTADGHDMDTYADDLATLTEKLDLKNAIHVGHSTGGGEVARYIGRHGTRRVRSARNASSPAACTRSRTSRRASWIFSSVSRP